MMLLEYGTLGGIAGVVGALGGKALAYLFSERVLEIPFRPDVFGDGLAIVLAALAVSAVGVATTLDVLRKKPLSVLRAG
jgi:putative ABC transport system permease protein